MQRMSRGKAAAITAIIWAVDVAALVTFGANYEAISRVVHHAVGFLGWAAVVGLLIGMMFVAFPWIGPVILYGYFTEDRGGER
jgi:hypothetical protein